MKQSIRNSTGEVFYEAEYDAEHQWLFVKLEGVLTDEDVNLAGDSFLELFKISGVKKLFADTCDVKGEYKNIKYWTVDTKMNRLSQLGLDYYAHVIDSDPRKIAMITSSMKSQGIDYKVFKNIGKAKKWLLSI